MFFDLQKKEQQERYKTLLKNMGALSNLFSENDAPYLPYRAHENIFCRAFDATNLSRGDITADAQKEKIGIGLKTWVGSGNQKVAEFNKNKPDYADLEGLDLVKKIADFRNERIRITKNMCGIDEMLYHVVKRIPNAMQIWECGLDEININNIRLLKQGNEKTNPYFNDGKHTYHFSVSKSTLYMIFDEMQLIDDFDVDILDDPYTLLEQMFATKWVDEQASPIMNLFEEKHGEMLKLKLYTVGSKKQLNGAKGYPIENTGKYAFVPLRSGINQWNANGRKRHEDELYIPYPASAKEKNPNFFPPRDEEFQIVLPDGTELSAKVCQENGKAIMSNPNKALGHWLLRDVFEVAPGTIISYGDLQRFGIDSVVFEKLEDKKYSVNFCLDTNED